MQFDGARHVIEHQMPEADLFALIEKTTERALKKIGVINQTPLGHQFGNTRFHSPIEFCSRLRQCVWSTPKDRFCSLAKGFSADLNFAPLLNGRADRSTGRLRPAKPLS